MALAQDQSGLTTWTVLAMRCQSLTVHIMAGVVTAVIGGVEMCQSSVPAVSRTHRRFVVVIILVIIVKLAAFTVVIFRYNVRYCEDLFVENCTASHPGCETIWNTNIHSVYGDLIAGSLHRDSLRSFCRFRLLYYVGYILDKISVVS